NGSRALAINLGARPWQRQGDWGRAFNPFRSGATVTGHVPASESRRAQTQTQGKTHTHTHTATDTHTHTDTTGAQTDTETDTETDTDTQTQTHTLHSSDAPRV